MVRFMISPSLVPVQVAITMMPQQDDNLRLRVKAKQAGETKLSNDVHFEEKFWDVIGLYLNPPEKALVLCCDEKSQC